MTGVKKTGGSGKPALGRGMASLLQSTAAQNFLSGIPKEAPQAGADAPPALPTAQEGIIMVDVTQVHANPHQPRKIFKEEELKELAQSIKENGLLQPIVITKTEKGFELIAGERRLRASRLAGLEKIPALLRRATDREKLVLGIIENVQRSNLNCVEEALAYFQLMEDYQLTQEELATKIGKDRSVIANFLRILKLPRAAIDLLQREKLSFGHAKVLAALPQDVAVKLSEEAATKNLSVRELELLVEEILGKKEKKKKVGSEDNIFEAFQEGLEKRLGLRVKVSGKEKSKGTIQLQFSTTEEFNLLYEWLMRFQKK